MLRALYGRTVCARAPHAGQSFTNILRRHDLFRKYLSYSVSFGRTLFAPTAQLEDNYTALNSLLTRKWKYGANNVSWKANSFEHIMLHPEILYGSSKSEIGQMLGDGWIPGTYGSAGTGWKYVKGDLSVFYHPGGGRHESSYYGFSSTLTGKVKIVGDGYIPTMDDGATIIKIEK